MKEEGKKTDHLTPALSPSGEGEPVGSASPLDPAPLLALSIRQPWAWLIMNGYKDIENRDWATNYRGRFLVHASGGMQWDEYFACKKFVAEIRLKLPMEWRDLRWWPEFQDLERGGIVGEAALVDCVTSDPSPWFVGPFGFVLQNVKKLPFVSTPGALKFFDPEKIKGKQLGLNL